MRARPPHAARRTARCNGEFQMRRKPPAGNCRHETTSIWASRLEMFLPVSRSVAAKPCAVEFVVNGSFPSPTGCVHATTRSSPTRCFLSCRFQISIDAQQISCSPAFWGGFRHKLFRLRCKGRWIPLIQGVDGKYLASGILAGIHGTDGRPPSRPCARPMA